MKLDVFVLAAGKSQRFGSPKQLQFVDGKPMALHAIDKIKHPCVLRKTLVTGAYHAQIEQFLPAQLLRIFAQDWELGLSASINTAVQHFAQDATHLMIVLADQIAIQVNEFDLLINTAVEHPSDIVSAQYQGIHGAPAIFPENQLALLTSLSGDSGAGSILKNNPKVRGVALDSAKYDVDTPADLQRMRKRR